MEVIFCVQMSKVQDARRQRGGRRGGVRIGAMNGVLTTRITEHGTFLITPAIPPDVL